MRKQAARLIPVRKDREAGGDGVGEGNLRTLSSPGILLDFTAGTLLALGAAGIGLVKAVSGIIDSVKKRVQGSRAIINRASNNSKILSFKVSVQHKICYGWTLKNRLQSNETAAPQQR